MRVVLDTNVLISAALKEKSLPGAVVYLAVNQHQLLASEATKAELVRVMAKPYLARVIAPAFTTWLTQTINAAETVEIKTSITDCRDEDDNKFLELAVNGHADIVVSGDDDLLCLHPFRGIPILTPAAFLAWVS